MRRLLITLMFLVVPKKSRTIFSFPCSANEQACRSWGGAQPGSQPKLTSGNIPYHGHHAKFIKGGWPGGRNLFSGSSVQRSFFCEFELIQELCKICEFHDCCSGIGCKMVIRW